MNESVDKKLKKWLNKHPKLYITLLIVSLLLNIGILSLFYTNGTSNLNDIGFHNPVWIFTNFEFKMDDFNATFLQNISQYLVINNNADVSRFVKIELNDYTNNTVCEVINHDEDCFRGFGINSKDYTQIKLNINNINKGSNKLCIKVIFKTRPSNYREECANFTLI